MDTKADKLAQARRKLRDYQSRNVKSRDETSSPSPSVSSLAETNGRRSVNGFLVSDSGLGFNHDDKKSPFERTRTASQSSVSSAATPANESLIAVNGNEAAPRTHVTEAFAVDAQSNLAAEVKRLASELVDSELERQRITTQLSELHGHYSEIYNAYKQLSEGLQADGAPESAAFTQLTHLQTAMSVVVTEKTSLQRQLREANETAGRRLLEIQSLTEELNDKKLRLGALDRDIVVARKEIESLSAVMQRQMEELDRGRREASSWQARFLRVQQDRNDAQERLKVCMKEAESAQAELTETRRQLRLKEIYLRQVGAFSNDSAVKEQDIQNLHEENERLKEELQKALDDVQRWKKETQTARAHYETYGSQLNQNILQIGSKLEEVSSEKLQLQSRVEELEDELEVIRAEERARNARRGSKENDNLFEMVKLRGELNEMTARVQQSAQLEAELRAEIASREALADEQKSKIEQMESEMSAKRVELFAVKDELARARLAADTQDRILEDIKSLTDQLQSEKATVSRAVAQNRELKDQLMELQDKLIAVSQESMERESGLLTAGHTIEQLRAEIEELRNKDEHERLAFSDEPNTHEETVCSSVDAEEDERDASMSRTEETRARLEGELARANMELGEIRSELRRVVQENLELRRIMEQNAEDENQNSIHVELGQAVERINALSAENEQLRERNRTLVDAAESGEHSAIPQNTAAAASPTESANNNASVQNAAASADNNLYQQSRLRGFAAPSPGEKPLAWTELEGRFSKAMRQNAELIEQNERLEHIIMQLESENDTIGEYVTIYHHQRKLLRDRMRDKDEAVARLSLEKEHVQEKLTELQKSVISVLRKKGVLRAYDQAGHCERGRNVAAAVSKRANQLRSFSQSRVDEVSGNEEVLVDGSTQSLPDVHAHSSAAHSSCHSDASEVESAHGSPTTGDDDPDESIGVQRILHLITELQDPERGRSLAPCDPNMHCRECRGKLITL